MAIQFPLIASDMFSVSRIPPIDILAFPEYDYSSLPPPPYEPPKRWTERMSAFKESNLLTHILDYNIQIISDLPKETVPRFKYKNHSTSSREGFGKSDDTTALIINTLDPRQHMQQPNNTLTRLFRNSHKPHIHTTYYAPTTAEQDEQDQDQEQEETIDDKMEKINISLQQLILEAQTSLQVNHDTASTTTSLNDNDNENITDRFEDACSPITPTIGSDDCNDFFTNKKTCQVHDGLDRFDIEEQRQNMVRWKESDVSIVHFSPMCWLAWKSQEERYIQSKKRINIALEQLEESIQLLYYSDDRSSRRRESNKRKSAPPSLYHHLKNQHQQNQPNSSNSHSCHTPKRFAPQPLAHASRFYPRQNSTHHPVESTTEFNVNSHQITQTLLERIKQARSSFGVLFTFSLTATYSGRRRSVSCLISPWMATHPWCVILLATLFLAMATLSSAKYQWPGPAWMLKLLLHCQKAYVSTGSPSLSSSSSSSNSSSLPTDCISECYTETELHSRFVKPHAQKHPPVYMTYLSHILPNVFH